MVRPLKILLIKSYPVLSSVGVLAKKLHERGHEVHVLVPEAHEDCRRMASAGPAVHVMPLPAASAAIRERALLVHRLGRFFREGEFDVIHLNLKRGRLYGRLASLFARRAVVVSSIRGYDSHYERWLGWIDDATVSVSEAVRQYCLSEGARNRKPIVIPNGVDLTAFDAVARDPLYLHRELGLAADIKLIGMVAFFRSTLNKGHRFFLEAAREVLSNRSDVRFVLVGGTLHGNFFDRSMYECFARELGIDGCVHFLGERYDIPAILSSLRAHVLPSAREGCPMVVLEAMARSVPNVCSRIPALQEIITDGKNGLLVTQGSSGELAAAIRRLLDNEQEAKALGQAGRALIENKFNADRMAAQYERLYCELLEKKRAHRGAHKGIRF